MAVCSVRAVDQLEYIHVLAPERYDPRKGSLLTESGPRTQILGAVANIVRQTIPFPTDTPGLYLVLDTSDAREGIIAASKTPIEATQIGSTKKRLQAGDVIVSRLRPYLRQVALIDREIPNWEQNVALVCSTEFFVLRSASATSDPIAFLVPFLLSEQVQRILALSQEGGHHPRFYEQILATLPIPTALLLERHMISETVEKSIKLFRNSERQIAELIGSAQRVLSAAAGPPKGHP